MTVDANDERIVDAIDHLRSAMRLLNAAGALQSAAHVATAIFCVPPASAAPAPPGDGAARTAAESWRDALANKLTR